MSMLTSNASAGASGSSCGVDCARSAGAIGSQLTFDAAGSEPAAKKNAAATTPLARKARGETGNIGVAGNLRTAGDYQTRACTSKRLARCPARNNSPDERPPLGAAGQSIVY